MLFRSKASKTTCNEVEPTLSPSLTSFEEMSDLLKQAVVVVEGLRSKCDRLELENNAARADLASAGSTLGKLEQSHKEKDRLLAVALESATRSKETLEKDRLVSALLEIALRKHIDALQMELEEIKTTAALRWGSLELKASQKSGSREMVLDLRDVADESASLERWAA